MSSLNERLKVFENLFFFDLLTKGMVAYTQHSRCFFCAISPEIHAYIALHAIKLLIARN